MHLRTNPKRNRIDLVGSQSAGGFDFSWRYVGVYLLILGVFSFLFLNLFNLQIIEGGENLLIATQINQSTSRIVPPRGLIFDSEGVKLAYNLPAYSLFINPAEVNPEDEEQLLTQLAGAMNIPEQELIDTYVAKTYTEEGERLTASRVTLKSNLDFDQYLALSTVITEGSGAYINVEAEREYPAGRYFSHILGYVGDPTEADIENGIYSESQVGKVGLERSYDDALRGVEGIEIRERGIIDDRERTYTPQDAKFGDNLYLTIDSQWQQKLTDIMIAQREDVDAFASAGVIMNSRTGEIEAMVSVPSYDNNLFAEGISAKDFNALLNDPKTPLLDRTIGLQLPPGSIWKIIGATIGLEEQVVSRNTEFLSDRCMELPGDILFCEADRGYLGNVNVIEAIEKSSNIYFCNVALEVNQKRNGIRTLIDYAERFGLGQRTGIDLPSEQSGTMASPELKERLLGEPWYTGDECNTIIGQGLVTVTPLQMTVVSSAVSNGGKVVKPHLVQRIETPTGQLVEEVESEVIRTIDVSRGTLDTVKEGMRAAAVSGTATGLGQLDSSIIAKTGSADAGEYIQGEYYVGAHSWVTGCFDYENENYCFTTMQQWGGRGYKTVPIMKKFINCVYNDFADSCENI